MARKKVESQTFEQIEQAKFTKNQLVKSKRYANCRDALSALLKDDETYTHEEVERILENFYKGGNK